MKIIRRKKRCSKSLKLLLSIWAIIFLSSKMPGLIEGNLFPVVENISISSSYRPYVPAMDIIMKYDEIRKCAIVSSSWIRSNDHTRVRISSFVDPIRIDTPARNYGQYNQKLLKWTILTSSYVDLTKSSTILEYDCHPFWNTIMRVDNHSTD